MGIYKKVRQTAQKSVGGGSETTTFLVFLIIAIYVYNTPRFQAVLEVFKQ